MIRTLPGGHTLANYLETCLARTGTDGETTDFRAQELRDTRGMRRTSRRMIIDCTTSHPKVVARLVRRSAPNTQYVGAGASVIACKVGDTVVKIYKNSYAMKETDRRSLAASEQADYEALRHYLGPLVIDQSIGVGRHILTGRHRVVHASQRFIEYDGLNHVFPADRPAIDQEALLTVFDESPGIEISFAKLASGGLKMRDEMRMVPDITGYRNIGINKSGDDCRLVVVDGQALNATRGWAAAHIVPQLQELDSLLRS